MATSVSKILFSKFIFWMAFAFGGCYFLFPNLFVRDTKNRFAMTRINLGIDLSGGTYITLGVDLDKLVEGRLNTEVKNIQGTFKTKKVKGLPQETEIKNQQITMHFANAEKAKIAYNVVEKIKTLYVQRREALVIATLTPAEDTKIRTNAIEQARQVIKSRVDGLGVSGSLVQRHGANQIVIQLPGVDDPERVKNLITKRALLEFKLVQDIATSQKALEDKFDGDIPPNLVVVSGEHGDEDIAEDETVGKWYLVSKYPDMPGDHVINSGVDYDEYHQPHVTFKLDREGGRIFTELTSNNRGKDLGIIIDNVMISHPRIDGTIGREGRITRPGGFTLKEARDLSLVLRTGSFQAPVTYQEERRIGPSLGQDSINRGIRSCLIGLGLVFIFIIFFFKIPGLFAMIALIYNLFLILLFLSLFEATLTLPGIAGIVLTIGMAIDASILIFENIREELATGAPYRKAINDGFKGVMAVIFDANITTFLTGLVLFYFGGPSIQGFAITLMAGIVATIFAGVFFLRSIFDFVLSATRIKQIPF